MGVLNLSFLPSSMHLFLFLHFPGAITLLLETLVPVKVFLGIDSGSN